MASQKEAQEALCLIRLYIRSYFANRKNGDKLDSVMSCWRDTVRGCPQGSSFGPLMWNIFQNDLPVNPTVRLAIYICLCTVCQ